MVHLYMCLAWAKCDVMAFAVSGVFFQTLFQDLGRDVHRNQGGGAKVHVHIGSLNKARLRTNSRSPFPQFLSGDSGSNLT